MIESERLVAILKGFKKRCPGEAPGQIPNIVGWRLTRSSSLMEGVPDYRRTAVRIVGY